MKKIYVRYTNSMIRLVLVMKKNKIIFGFSIFCPCGVSIAVCKLKQNFPVIGKRALQVDTAIGDTVKFRETPKAYTTKR